jgi:transposase
MNTIFLLTFNHDFCILYTLIMATLQKRTSRGHNYWSIVESRRVNGKPRPVILEYLGTANNLLKRLAESVPQKVRSYSHGAVAVMLDIAEELQIVQTINKYVQEKQVRDDFTVGGSLLLAAIGRFCHPTSKKNWYHGWAKHTSLSYLIGMSLKKLDSQHFWDQMNVLPVDAIPLIEEEIIKTLLKKNDIPIDTLLYDTTNFFTYINSTNRRCPIVQRGKNKQKRTDLRQFGLLLLVSRQDCIPLFHQVYTGNLADKTVFEAQFKNITSRLKNICGTLKELTMVFDQGNNSKKILKNVSEKTYFVGALSPHHHKNLVTQANKAMKQISVKDTKIKCYRTRMPIWQLDVSVVVYISEKLRQGQIRGTMQHLQKLFQKLAELKDKIAFATQQGPKRTREKLEKKIVSLIKSSKVPKLLVGWELTPGDEDSFQLSFWIDKDHFKYLKEQWYGRRILISNRHEWSTAEIIDAYWGQHVVETAFKNMKNPFHMALRPQFHWTTQKVTVHAFICLIAFLLGMVAYKRAKERAHFDGCPHTLIETLNSIRLATLVNARSGKRNQQYQAKYQLEEMDPDAYAIAEAFELTGEKITKSKIPFSVYI